ncbi:MAG: RtcB family protein [Chloroflexi bacterium]|nr:RtcB family protein [Chloroflexota bacterium]
MPPVLRRLDDFRWEIPVSYKQGMRVPGVIFADRKLMETIREDQSLEQVANVAFLPGIVGASLAMPDVHWGYGFPVGGVAATDVQDGGVISPGGVGFDINCGVRLLRSDLTEEDVRPHLRQLVAALFHNVPSGVGSSGRLRLKPQEMNEVMTQGARWAVKKGFGVPEDLEATEEGGCIRGADPSAVGPRPRQRGAPQLGTLGSGNHFLEVQVVDEVFDADAARAMGIHARGQVTVLVHCGSRGFGHQVCEDSLRVMNTATQRHGIQVPDRQLACVPVRSPEGESYLQAMWGAANFAFANRQCIAHWIRESFSQVFQRSWEEMGLSQVYDVCHNVAKIEEYVVDGKRRRLCVHRKGATRAFPPGHPELPTRYREVGQPVLIPGDMGRYSYLAVGTQAAMELSFGSTCHGAGRTQSRTSAKRLLKGHDIQQELEARGIIVMAQGWASLAEEASIAYKDVADVVDVAQGAGISRKVARMRPLGVVKG